MTKKIDIKEFVEEGYLQEVNRLFLHSLGLALEVTQEEDGSMHLSGVWDAREDPEGIVFDSLDRDKALRIWDVKFERGKVRQERLGFDIQPIPTDGAG